MIISIIVEEDITLDFLNTLDEYGSFCIDEIKELKQKLQDRDNIIQDLTQKLLHNEDKIRKLENAYDEPIDIEGYLCDDLQEKCNKYEKENTELREQCNKYKEEFEKISELNILTVVSKNKKLFDIIMEIRKRDRENLNSYYAEIEYSDSILERELQNINDETSVIMQNKKRKIEEL